jgi:hypothetical protein
MTYATPKPISVSQLQLSLSRSLNKASAKKTALLVTKSGKDTHLVIPCSMLPSRDFSTVNVKRVLSALAEEGS